MSATTATIVAALAILTALLLAVLLVRTWRAAGGRIREARRDAVQRSQAVTAGKVVEQLVPYLPGFAFDPRDARFLGSPIDLVVFDGLSGDGDCRIVFVEVKTGGSALSGRERRVREAVRAGRVEWVELRV